jgi:hypothetical protein
MEKEKKQLCPSCGCHIGESAHEKGSVIYCCQPCAEGKSSQCGCGCCTETALPAVEG